MMLIDSHSHLFSEEFADDLPLVIERARLAGLSHIFMPNIDSTTIDPLLAVCETYKGFCFPMIGLHPTSVNESYESELKLLAQRLSAPNEFVAIGEVGMDLYWDKSYLKEQQIVFERQIEWALTYHLPLVIHSRDSFEQVLEILKPYKDTPLKGVFHSFTGNLEEAVHLLDFSNFMIGINGVVTFKKSQLPNVVKELPLDRIVLETDAPYLTPTPNRGKRNESAYIKDTLTKIADIYQLPPELIAQKTSQNALELFGMLK